MTDTTNAVERYADVLAAYLADHGEQALYQASILSKQFVESGLGPEEIIPIHLDALERAMAPLGDRELARAVGDAHQVLLEVMIAYGVRYREYLDLRLLDGIREAEARTERERQRAAEAQRAERERGELLATIAHELRSPLSAAMGNIDLAKRSLSHGMPDAVPSLLESSRSALDRLSRLSADLVQASRGDRPRLAAAEFAVARVLDQVCAWARPAAADKGLILAGPEGVDGRVVADGEALLSVFGNLLANAVRYTPPGGCIAVRHGAANGHVWVEVEDTGIGMSPEVQARVFERFYRAPDAVSSDLGGLGLGLALVRDLVEAHGGRIAVRSAAGAGSTFRVTLPAAAGHPTAPRASAGNAVAATERDG